MESQKILIYDLAGGLRHVQPLTAKNLEDIHGMMTRCVLKDGAVKEGFSDTFGARDGRPHFDGTVHDYILLWTWANWDEEHHRLIGEEGEQFDQIFEKVPLDELESVEAILYSNPRWESGLMNHFPFPGDTP